MQAVASSNSHAHSHSYSYSALRYRYSNMFDKVRPVDAVSGFRGGGRPGASSSFVSGPINNGRQASRYVRASLDLLTATFEAGRSPKTIC